MAFGVGGVVIRGQHDVMRRLKQLQPRVRKRVLEKAIKKATKPIVPAARARSRSILSKRGKERSGELERSIGQVIRTRKTGTIVAVIGPRRDHKIFWRGRAHDPAIIAPMLELGHAIGRRGRRGGPIRGALQRLRSAVGLGGFVRPYPFLGPAFRSVKGRVQKDMVRLLWEGIRKEASKG